MPRLRINKKIAKCNDCKVLNLVVKGWRKWEKIEREMTCGKCGGKMTFIEDKKELEREMKKC